MLPGGAEKQSQLELHGHRQLNEALTFGRKKRRPLGDECAADDGEVMVAHVPSMLVDDDTINDLLMEDGSDGLFLRRYVCQF
jgi:hypothetical protein